MSLPAWPLRMWFRSAEDTIDGVAVTHVSGHDERHLSFVGHSYGPQRNPIVDLTNDARTTCPESMLGHFSGCDAAFGDHGCHIVDYLAGTEIHQEAQIEHLRLGLDVDVEESGQP
jgi:hypothetical protein